MRQNHALFKRYPLDGTVQVGGESLSTPYHVYDGSILFIGGTANVDAAAELLRTDEVTPILDTQGNALIAVWVCDFTEANLGAHHELQFSIFASFKPQPRVPSHAFAIYRMLTLNSDVVMVCHGLWNNTERVVNYNRDHLALDAHLSTSRIDRTSQRWRFDVVDAKRGNLIVEGELSYPKRQSPQALMAMSKHLGVRGMFATMSSPFIHVPVANTRGTHAENNRVAHTYTRSDRQFIRYFESQDRLLIHDTKYVPLNFRPQFVQYNDGVRFVYLDPQTP
jgi:hypothetical protein